MQYTDLIGVPFKDGGRNKNGLDCWGLVKILLERQCYKYIQDYYISAFNIKDIHDELETNRHTWRKIEKPEVGCVVLLANGCTAAANHVGIVVDDSRFIHAYARTGVCVSALKRWQAHIRGYYLPPEVRT